MSLFGLAINGVNLDVMAKNVIRAVHRDVEIQVCEFSHYDTAPDGAQLPKYLPPVTVKAQMQVPTAQELKKVEKTNDNMRQKVFYIDANVAPMERKTEDGGPVILFSGRVWYVVAFRDDFRHTGWVSVIATMTLDDPADYLPDPALPPPEPEPEP